MSGSGRHVADLELQFRISLRQPEAQPALAVARQRVQGSVAGQVAENRRPFLLISTDPAAAFAQGWRVRLWDFLFYASFGVVVTSSVRIAGVLLVFAYLIVPALAGVAWGTRWGNRLALGWSLSATVSLVGMGLSAYLDLPTGATIVTLFGVALAAAWTVMALVRTASRPAAPGEPAELLPRR